MTAAIKPPPKNPAPYICERCHKSCHARSWDPTKTVARNVDGPRQLIEKLPRLICAACKAALRAEAIAAEGKPPEACRRPTAADLTIPMFSTEDMQPRRAAR